MAVVRVKTEANLMSLNERHQIFSQNGTEVGSLQPAESTARASWHLPARGGLDSREGQQLPSQPPHLTAAPAGP